MAPRKIHDTMKEWLTHLSLPSPTRPNATVVPDPQSTGRELVKATSLALQVSGRPVDHLARTTAMPSPATPDIDAGAPSLAASAASPFTAAIPASTILTSILPEEGARRRRLGWKAFIQGMGVLKEVSVIFPPLQAAVAGLFRILEQIGEITDARDDFAAMAQRLTALASLLQRYEGRTDDEDIRNRLDGMTSAITAQILQIERKLGPGIPNIVKNSPDADYIIERTRVVSFLITVFETDTALNTEAKASEIKNLISELHDHHMLERLSPVAGSYYNEGGALDSVGHSGECMPGTRVNVLAALITWATDPQSPAIYMLTGMAGSGKSAITRSFCRLLDEQSLLGASFFCSRASETRSNAGAIIPSLAFHLAWHSEPYARALIAAIKANPGVTFNLRTADFQFATLLLHPSQALSQTAPWLVVVIDALDECSSIHATRALLNALIPSNEVRLKFFITSRPEPHVETAFQSQVVMRRLRLHDVERDIVTADIAKYLRRNLRDLASRTATQLWPSTTDLENLVQQTGDLFIFAFTTIQYLSGRSLSHEEVQRRLHNILHDRGSSTRIQTTGIDALYSQIVDNAWNGIELDEKIARQNVLTTIICLREPLSFSAMSGLLAEDPEKLKLLLDNFHSVIDVPASLEAPVLVFHASFPDYMTDKHRSGENTLNIPAYHAMLALQCIQSMNSSLHQNLCGLTYADSIDMVSEDTVNQSIPPHLRYASMHWGTHLSIIPVGAATESLISELQLWSTKHLLHWLECLSIIGNLHLAVDCLQKAILWLSVHTKTISITIFS
ncbi:hypothetical protein B0H13DRAFT_455612 [Mycena leptocephala]|nr:hypothetical protein B0H13DRAFT_455612 [Mycena leptocephala]